MLDVEDICYAIKCKDRAQLKEQLEFVHSLQLISTTFETNVIDYDHEKEDYVRTTINFLGKSYFHLIAFTSNLEILMMIQSKLLIPIIPVDIKTLQTNNPFQHLWDHGKITLLSYCISLCEQTSLDTVFEKMNIDVTRTYGNCLKNPPQQCFDRTMYEQQKQWVNEQKWPLICDAIGCNQWLYSIHQLIENEALGLRTYIEDNCSKDVDNKYQKLKNLALHEKDVQTSIQKKHVYKTKRDSPIKSSKKIPKVSMFSRKNIKAICIVTIGLGIFCRYYFSNNSDDLSPNLANGPN